jgi:hypothetical protein
MLVVVTGTVVWDPAAETTTGSWLVAVGCGLLGVDSRGPFDPVFADFPCDRVAMKAQHLGGIADVAFRTLERAGDEHLFEFPPRIVVEDSLFQKFLDELLELIAHGQRSSRPDSRRKASTYFSRVRRITSSGSDGTGGCLFQRISSR